ncbi:hypothetical protein COHA_003530 [Chlorella ohadii]|uniref:Amino acid transporter transmembrane domain-containing protein n=1 Tax=Chlorella ohadii TaxID=2649997 RepID=A0AAD5DUR5_9CHLO|nr:hypothetical protein COHA_003530 [Chlorella ohadii]
MAAQGQFISMPGGGGTEGDDKSHGQASKSRASLADASTEDVESQQELKGSLQAGASGLRRRKGDSVEEEPEAEPELEMQRHGTWKSCVGHIITAVIGSGVLYLPYFFAILGWIGGIIMTLTFGAITWYTSSLLADAMVIKGVRYRTYQSAVEAVFGRRGGILLAVIQYPNLVLTAIAYNITAATSMKYFATSYKSFADTSLCTAVDETTGYCTDCKLWVFGIIFAGVQLFMSQLPNLVRGRAAAGQAGSADGVQDTSVSGYPVSRTGASQKTFDIFNAWGGIVFAFSFRQVCKDGGRGPVWHMKRAVWVGTLVITVFYFFVSVLGYLAYGETALYANNYIIDFWSNSNSYFPTTEATTNVARAANMMVLIHMIPAYQVFSQPVFAAIERTMRHRKGSRLAATRRWTFRLLTRSLYVAVVCFVAIALPFFSDFVGLIGALGFWPATVLFPVEMYRKLHKPGKWKTIWLESLNVFCCLITICAIIGSVQLIVRDASSYSFF